MNICQVKNRYEGQLLQMPNVMGIGIGEREGKEIIKVFVIQKIPESALRPQEIIPKILEGYATDVEEIGTVRTLNC